MSLTIRCSECGGILGITEEGGSIRETIYLRVRPCQTCLDAAEIHGLEDANNQEKITRDPALFLPDGSPKSVEEACEPQKGD